jgi:hypothetical protein
MAIVVLIRRLSMLWARLAINHAILHFPFMLARLPDAVLPTGFPRTVSDTQPKNAQVQKSQDGWRFWKRSRTGHGPTIVLASLGITSTSVDTGPAGYRGQFEKRFAGTGRSRPVLWIVLQF